MRKLYSFLHKICEIHVLMNIFTVSAILNLWLRMDLRQPLFIFYALAVPVLFTTKMIYLIKTRKIDEEFDSSFAHEKK